MPASATVTSSARAVDLREHLTRLPGDVLLRVVGDLAGEPAQSRAAVDDEFGEALADVATFEGHGCEAVTVKNARF